MLKSSLRFSRGLAEHPHESSMMSHHIDGPRQEQTGGRETTECRTLMCFNASNVVVIG